MTVDIARVDPHSIVERAAAVLDEAWPQPCFHYTPGYLAWQFGYPSCLPPHACGAFHGDRLIGFIGVCPRRVRANGIATDVYVLSFVSVLPSFQGRGVAGRLYDRLLSSIDPSVDVFVFAETGSPAEAVLVKACRRARPEVRGLAPQRGYGAAVLPNGAGAFRVDASGHELETVVSASVTEGVAWNHPTPAQLAHYASDPRGAALFVAGERGGGGAIATLYEFATQAGVERVPALDCVFLPSGSAEHLRGLVVAASHTWSSAGAPVVMLPNAGTIAASVLREAGFRSTKASFTPYILSNDPRSPLLGAGATNLEII